MVGNRVPCSVHIASMGIKCFPTASLLFAPSSLPMLISLTFKILSNLTQKLLIIIHHFFSRVTGRFARCRLARRWGQVRPGVAGRWLWHVHGEDIDLICEYKVAFCGFNMEKLVQTALCRHSAATLPSETAGIQTALGRHSAGSEPVMSALCRHRAGMKKIL